MSNIGPHSPEVSWMEPLGFRIWERRGGGAGMPAPHVHHDIEINFLSRGWLTYLFAGRFETVRPGQWALFWGGLPHQSVEAAEGLQGVWLTLPLERFLSWELPEDFAASCLAGRFHRVELAGSREAEAFDRWLQDGRAGGAVRRRALLLELEALIARSTEAAPTDWAAGAEARPSDAPAGRIQPKLLEAAELLARRFREEVSIEAIAREVGWHPKYLASRFKERFGVGPAGYIARLRLAEAKRLLVTTDLTVTDVALESGFGALSSFYYAFGRAHPDLRPAAFRRRFGRRGSGK